MEVVFYSDQEVWDTDHPNPIIRDFLASPLPICLCTQLEVTNGPDGFLAKRGTLPTRVVKLPVEQQVVIIDAIDIPIRITTQEEHDTMVLNAVDFQGTSMQAAIKAFILAASTSLYPFNVFCFYGPIDLAGCTIPFTRPLQPVLLKTPSSPIQVMIASTFDSPKILTDSLSSFTSQIDSTRIQILNNQGYLIALNLINYINLDVTLSGTVQTYPLDIWAQVLRQYLENPFPMRAAFPLKTVFIIVLAIVLLILQLRALVRT
jgi:hypothetical protein